MPEKKLVDAEKISNRIGTIKAAIHIMLTEIEDIEAMLNISKKKPVDNEEMITRIKFNRRRELSMERARIKKLKDSIYQ